MSWAAVAFAIAAGAAFAQAPYGLDARAPIGPYLNNVMPPRNGAFAFPPVLSATGAFRDLQTLAPSDGLVPFAVNSPLWTDGALKSRWMAVPNDGAPYGVNEQIGFTAVGEWSFPNGTVFVKQFDMTINEMTGERRRLETRFLVRNADGGVYGVTYKWRSDNSDADLLPDGLEEKLTITDASGATRIQNYTYPSRANCLFCHNQVANYVLGPKTHQLNGDVVYPETGRTDNQLRTLNHLGLLNPAQSETSFATYLKSVPVSNTSVPVQYRMRSWIDANCSHCHRPGGFGPGYDGRFYTPLENQNLINNYVKFRNVSGSLLHQRDNAVDELKMPPLAKNIVHQTAMAALRQWIASPLEVLSVYLHQDNTQLAVRFNSHINPATATVASNYSLDQGITITQAVAGPEPDTVILTVSALTADQTYRLTTSGVEDTAPSANTIWPQSGFEFVARTAAIPTSPRLANVSSRLPAGQDDNVLVSGFIVRGGPAKRVLVRAAGPSLASSGIANALADPILELHDSAGVTIARNDNWADNANQQEIIDTGIAPASPAEAVILMKLPSSETGVAYTAVLRGADDTTGVGLIEIFDLDRGIGSHLLNVSTRGLVQTGDNVLIAGTIVAGPGSQKILVRAIGPSLSIPGKLSDPTLELRDANGGLIRANDNWRTGGQEAEILATTIPPASDLEAAIVHEAGANDASYTAIVRGVNDTTGIAVVEVYALQ
jgi:hypothetical protein